MSSHTNFQRLFEGILNYERVVLIYSSMKLYSTPLTEVINVIIFSIDIKTEFHCCDFQNSKKAQFQNLKNTSAISKLSYFR
jgi:hypothetical protein